LSKPLYAQDDGGTVQGQGVQIGSKGVTLNHEWHLGANTGAIEYPIIANHDAKGGYQSGRKVKEFGNPILHKIVGTIAIDQNRNAMVVDTVIKAKGHESGHSQHGI